jgi:hypothetical protein
MIDSITDEENSIGNSLLPRPELSVSELPRYSSSEDLHRVLGVSRRALST